MHLMAEPDMAGQVVKCPSCDSKIQIPAAVPPPDSASLRAAAQNAAVSGGRMHPSGQPQLRKAWKEEDPTNPNAKLSFGIGLAATLVWFAIIYFFQAVPAKPSSDYTTGEVL